MIDIAKQLVKLTSWMKGREALEKLATLPLETKRAKVYPKVIELAVKYWSDPVKGGSGLEVENFVNFIVAELAVEPDLANTLFTALAKRPLQVRPEHFYRLVGQARDKRAVPLLRGMWKKFPFQWAGAALALDAPELGDDVAAFMAHAPHGSEMELELAAGVLGGTKALAELRKQAKSDFVSRPAMVAVALAIAGHDDEAYFKDLRRAGDGQTAKRLHAALNASKPKDRAAAIDGFATHVDKPKAWVPVAMQFALSRMLLAEDPYVVEEAAKAIKTYVDGLIPNVRGRPEPWHAYFLRMAQGSITRGVSKPVRATLDEIGNFVPRAPKFED
ncbi:MAG: hypothetical protein QM817_08830 [Archangium sp.]